MGTGRAPKEGGGEGKVKGRGGSRPDYGSRKQFGGFSHTHTHTPRMGKFAKLDAKDDPVWTRGLSRGKSREEKEVWKLV